MLPKNAKRRNLPNESKWSERCELLLFFGSLKWSYKEIQKLGGWAERCWELRVSEGLRSHEEMACSTSGIMLFIKAVTWGHLLCFIMAMPSMLWRRWRWRRDAAQCNEPTQPSLAPCWTCRQHTRSSSILFEKKCVAWFGLNLKFWCLLQKCGLQLGSVIDVNHTAVRLINLHTIALRYAYGCLTGIDQKSRCGDADNIYKHMNSTACRDSFCFAGIEPSVNAFYYTNWHGSSSNSESTPANNG